MDTRHRDERLARALFDGVNGMLVCALAADRTAHARKTRGTNCPEAIEKRVRAAA